MSASGYSSVQPEAYSASCCRPTISVCMATYQGEKYISKQIESIVLQLRSGDELIVSDDSSTDGTRDIVQRYIDDGYPIKLVDGPCLGFNSNFANALKMANGDFIFFSDQDDEWLPGKVDAVIGAFKDPNVLVVVHDAEMVDRDGRIIDRSLHARRRAGSGMVRNLVQNSYTGCCMAIRKRFKDEVLPFPKRVAYFDWWIGLLADCRGTTVFLDSVYLEHRRHGDNASPDRHYSLHKMIAMRMELSLALFWRIIKLSTRRHLS